MFGVVYPAGKMAFDLPSQAPRLYPWLFIYLDKSLPMGFASLGCFMIGGRFCVYIRSWLCV
jgi:hypothetical protein